MSTLQALILGILQGLTEFLPVSSSGHLELGHALLGVENKNSLLFAVVVHGATVLSTLVVFRKDIIQLVKGLLEFKWNYETRYVAMLLVSALPVTVFGIFFRPEIESLYNGNLFMVGLMLIFTALLLSFTNFAQSGKSKIKFKDAIIIGVAQAMAVMPGISRSGFTIASGLLLGKKKKDMARFSFLMVLIPIIGANMVDIFSGELKDDVSIGFFPLLVGFVAAFVSGLLACKWMIRIVKEKKLIYFAAYCLVIGLIAIFAG